MRAEHEVFDSGWVGLRLRLRPGEFDELVALRQELKAGRLGHFHLRTDQWDAAPGVADVEFSVMGESDHDNMRVG